MKRSEYDVMRAAFPRLATKCDEYLEGVLAGLLEAGAVRPTADPDAGRAWRYSRDGVLEMRVWPPEARARQTAINLAGVLPSHRGQS